MKVILLKDGVHCVNIWKQHNETILYNKCVLVKMNKINEKEKVVMEDNKE
jgi:hypothetical protein